MLHRHVYQQIIVNLAKEFEQILSVFKDVVSMNQLNDESLINVANVLQKEFFETNSVIVEEEDIGDKLYIIRAGTVTITKEKEGKVAELGRGQLFGEKALLTDEPRQALVMANAPGVECLTLTRPQFKEHFSHIIVSKKQNSATNSDSNQ